MAILNFGSINWDHVYQVPHFVRPGETLGSTCYTKVLGGKGANQSVALARAGAQVAHIGCVATGDSAIDLLKAENIDTLLVHERDDAATGHAIIQVNDEGENAIVLFAGANHKLSETQIDAALEGAADDDWVLLQNETNDIEGIVSKARKRGLKIAFNPAPMDMQLTRRLLGKIDLLIVNEVEVRDLTEKDDVDTGADAIIAQHPELKLVVTLGKDGVRYYAAEERLARDGFKVDAIDTTAAGDTFIGYFLAVYCDSADVERGLEQASAAAALCVTRAGAIPAIPSLTEVSAFLGK